MPVHFHGDTRKEHHPTKDQGRSRDRGEGVVVAAICLILQLEVRPGGICGRKED